MAVPSWSPGLVREIAQRTSPYATVWLVFLPGVVWYSFSSPPYLYRYPTKPGPTWMHVMADVVVALSCFIISIGRIAKATLWEQDAAAKAFDVPRKNFDLQDRGRTALKW